MTDFWADATFITEETDLTGQPLTLDAFMEALRAIDASIPLRPMTIQVSAETAQLIVEHDLFPDTIGPLVRKAMEEAE